MNDPDQRGYLTPAMADVETAYRRLVRFQLKVMAAFVAVLLVIAGVVIVVVVKHRDASQPATAVVPDVDGFDNVSTAIAFDHAGLALAYIRLDKASTKVPIGHVIRTDPPAGTQVKRGALVRVTFSCGRVMPEFCEP